MKPTLFEDINLLLDSLAHGIQGILKDNLVGLYLMGSLSYGDFNPDRSDIDLVAIVEKPLMPETLVQIKEMHFRIEASYKEWAERIECSYTPLEMLKNILPPEQPRPYIGDGRFYDEATYGNEWIINNYLLYQHGITLSGPDFRSLIPPIDIAEVQKASARDLYREWVPKITDPDYLDNSHNQSYVVLNLCRILYTVLYGKTGSKKVSAEWVKSEFSQWRGLIEEAEGWKYGMEMKRKAEAIGFIHFTVEKVGHNIDAY